MKPIRVASAVIATSMLACALPAAAEGGRIGFVGGIVGSTCPMRAETPDCPLDRPVAVRLRSLDPVKAQDVIGSTLLDYALRREPGLRWRVLDVTYP